MCPQSHCLRASLLQRLDMSGLRRCYGDCDGMRRRWLEGGGMALGHLCIEIMSTCQNNRNLKNTDFKAASKTNRPSGIGREHYDLTGIRESV
jgi:hypothetical protein